MFKPANPDSKLHPTLQNGTKENFVAQITVAAVFITGMYVVEKVQELKLRKSNRTPSTETPNA